MRLLPNVLSFLRILLVLPIIFFLESKIYLLAAILFFISSITDFFDGFLARRYGIESELGAFLDLIADKILVISVLVWLVFIFSIQALTIISTLIILREIIITSFRYYLVLDNADADLIKVNNLMSSLRNAVGDQIEIMVDFHGRCASGIAAIQYIKELEPYNPMFVEEPILPGDNKTLLQIKNSINCPLATGERLIGQLEFEDIISMRSIDIAQPDLNHCGGLLEAKNISAAAAVANIGIAPHNPNGPIAGAAALHFAASTPNHIIQEVMDKSVAWYEDVISTTPIVRNGDHWEIPDTVGLGIEVNEKEALKYPFKQEIMPTTNAYLDDGTVVDW